jgi:monoamine oxidase
VEFKLKSPEDFTAAEYQRELKSWCQARKGAAKSKPASIAIVGAGMAGLVTAWLLREVGHDVTIFEASPSAGGRIKTIRFGKGGPYAEAGAMRIPRSHSLTTWLTEDLFGLQTWKFNSADENALYYINNEHCRAKDYIKNNDVFRFALSPREREFKPAPSQGLAAALFERCLDNFISYELKMPGIKVGELGSLPPGKIKSIRRGFDRFSLTQFLMEKSFLEVSGTSSGKKTKPVPDSKLSQAARDFITSVLGLEMHLSCSLLAVIDDYLVLHGDGEMRQIQYGMDYLPRAFLGISAPGQRQTRLATSRPNLKGMVKFNVRVTEVARAPHSDDDKAKLVVKFARPGSSRERQDSFDRVIIAIPFSAMRQIRMPQLTGPAKRRALRQLHYDNSCKVLLIFREPFWRKIKIRGGRSITDLAIRQICYPIKEQEMPGANILLASYTWGEDSLRWTALNKSDRLRFALRDLERVHKRPLKDIYVKGTSHSWAEAEFTSGAFAMFEPYQLTELFRDVWRPEGLIHYCGEHTSTKHGWIEGAVESAVRVALEVCASVDHNVVHAME